MGKIFINATKNYGDKIKNIVEREKSRVDGVYYNLADIQTKHITELNNFLSGKIIFKDFPIYYLLYDNSYISKYLNPTTEAVKDRDGNVLIQKTTEGNNKLLCLKSNVDFPKFESLPLESSEYVDYRDDILFCIKNYYLRFYQNCPYMTTPTFLLDKTDSWKDIIIDDVLQHTNIYLKDESKRDVFLSVLINVELFNSFNVANKLLKYIRKYSFLTGISVSITNSASIYTYDSKEYQNILSFIKELNFNDVKVFMNYCGIKDIPFSILDIERFGVGWFSSFRSYDLESKGIDISQNSSFGKRIKKILLEYFMSEIPLELLEVLKIEDILEIIPVPISKLDDLSLSDLEQLYWIEFLKIIEKNQVIEEKFTGDELTIKRCDLMLQKLDFGLKNLKYLVKKLNESGRFDDAKKLENTNIYCIMTQIGAIREFKNKILI